MSMYFKKTYPNNPYRPNSGVFKDRIYTTAIALANSRLVPVSSTFSLLMDGYESCSAEEYQKIIKDNADFEKSITKVKK